MRRLLLSTAVLTFLILPAMAQPESRRVGKASVAPEVQDRAQAQLRGQSQQGDNGRGRGRERGNPSQSAVLENGRDQQGRDRGDRNERDRGERGAAPAPQATIQSPQPSNRGERGNWQGRDNRGDNNRSRGVDRRDWNNGRDFNRDGRTDYRRSGYGGPRRDFSGFRDYHRGFNASRRFNVPTYRRPAGWYERRWTFGEFLPAAFWARDYWIVDFEEYDLPPPPYGAVWVRVGGDALLIDEDSGEIITIAYRIFY
jgi:Ni/Co efflux regulator RcnB